MVFQVALIFVDAFVFDSVSTSLRDKSIGIIQVLSYLILLKYQLQFLQRRDVEFFQWMSLHFTLLCPDPTAR